MKLQTSKQLVFSDTAQRWQAPYIPSVLRSGTNLHGQQGGCYTVSEYTRNAFQTSRWTQRHFRSRPLHRNTFLSPFSRWTRPLTTKWSPSPVRLIRTTIDNSAPGLVYRGRGSRRKSSVASTMSRYSRPPNTSLFVRNVADSTR